MAPKRPTHKKSVSFSDRQTSPSTEDGTYTVPFSWRSVPVHIPVLFYSLFNQELSYTNIPSVLTKSATWLLVLQLLFSCIFNAKINEQRKSKIRVLKLSASDYSLVLIALIINTLAVPAIYLLAVVFGAPFTTYLTNTLLLSIHISLLCLPATVSCLKTGSFSPSFYKYFALVLIGAWTGAVAIPLDWDRPWQNWPMTIVGGGYLGAFAGYSLGWLV